MTFPGNRAYLNSEAREDIPLKSGKKSKWCFCNEDYLSGSKYVKVSFGTITAVITVALFVQIYYGDYQIVPHGSVATDSLECSNVGTQILKQGGNAVDAAIASTFCLAVATPHVTGLDTGGIVMIYNHRNRLLPRIIKFGHNGTNKNWPRLVSGLFYVHEVYGILSWETLLEPAISLARQGYLVTKQLTQALKNINNMEIFGKIKQGQVLKQEALARTLKQFAFIKDADNAISTFQNNIVQDYEAVKIQFYNNNIFVPNISLITPILTGILHGIKDYNFTKKDIFKPEYINRVIYLMKKMYQEKNVTTVNHEGSFSSVAAMDKEDNYVSVVTGFYQLLGSGEINSDGYIVDLKKDIECSRFPIILTNAQVVCGRRFVFGANNIFEALQILLKLVIANENATDSVESQRFIILNNGTVAIEDVRASEFFSSINIVEKSKDDLKSHSDSRGGGIASRY